MRRSKTKTALLSFAAILGLIAVLVAVLEQRRFRSGERLAGRLITEARANNGIVALSSFGDKVCILPAGVYPLSYAEEFFPQHTIYGEVYYDSDGKWFFLAGVTSKRFVEIYSISQGQLGWDIPEVGPLHANIACLKHLAISTRDGMPKILPIKEPRQNE
jgi:hypothetical protein